MGAAMLYILGMAFRSMAVICPFAIVGELIQGKMTFDVEFIGSILTLIVIWFIGTGLIKLSERISNKKNTDDNNNDSSINNQP